MYPVRRDRFQFSCHAVPISGGLSLLVALRAGHMHKMMMVALTTHHIAPSFVNVICCSGTTPYEYRV